MKGKKASEEGRLVVATNRRARHKYEVLEAYEAGLSLNGSEVKSLRSGKCSLDGAFARVDGGQAWLHNLHIPPYPQSRELFEPTRTRRLLLHAREIKRLYGLTQMKGMTMVPLEVYFKRGWAKVAIGLVKAKAGPDKREEIRKRDLDREMAAGFKGKFRASPPRLTTRR